MSTCRSCGDSIIWTVTANGSRMPVNETPDPNGRLVLDEIRTPPVAEYAKPGDPPGPRFTSHFVTCPDRATWRKRS
jgi:hypothetical protein